VFLRDITTCRIWFFFQKAETTVHQYTGLKPTQIKVHSIEVKRVIGTKRRLIRLRISRFIDA